MWARQAADVQKEECECKELDQKTVSLDPHVLRNTGIYRGPLIHEHFLLQVLPIFYLTPCK